MIVDESNSKNLRKFYEGVLKLKTVEECAKFFRDVCTLKELDEISERFEIAKMIEKGIPYRNISEKTGASTATITRVAMWLHHGKGGYRLVLGRLNPS